MRKPKVNKNSSFFHERAEELRSLYNSLEAKFSGQYVDLTPLQKAAKKLDDQANGAETIETWGYNITNLVLPIGNIHNVEPSGIHAKVSISCSCLCNIKDWKNTNCDPFLSYSFKVRVFGDLDGVTYSWGMHIDKETNMELDEWHPTYHLHCFEGRSDAPTYLMDSIKKKGSLLLNVPRLTHYPLDIVLGVGFCLMNFHRKEAFLTFYHDDQQFPRLYKKSQERILKPYFESLAGIPGCVFNKKELCPQIV